MALRNDPIREVLDRKGPVGASIERANAEAEYILQEAIANARRTKAVGAADAREQLMATVAKHKQERTDQQIKMREKMQQAREKQRTQSSGTQTDPVEEAIPETFDISTAGPGPSPGRFAPTSVAAAAEMARGGAGAQSAMAGAPGSMPVSRPQQAPGPGAMPGGATGPMGGPPSVTVGGQSFQAPPLVGTLRATRATDYETMPSGARVPSTRYAETFDIQPQVLTPGDILRAKQEQISQAAQERQFERTLRVQTFTELNKDYPEHAGKLTMALVNGDGPAIERAFSEAGPALSSKVMQQQIEESKARSAAAYATVASENEQGAMWRLQRRALQFELDREAAGDELLRMSGMPDAGGFTFSSGKSAKGKSATDLLGIADDIYDKDGKIQTSRMMDATMLQSALLRKAVVYSIEGATHKEQGWLEWAGSKIGRGGATSGAYRLDAVLDDIDATFGPRPGDKTAAQEWDAAKARLEGTGLFEFDGQTIAPADNYNRQVADGVLNIYRNLKTTEQKTGKKDETPAKLAATAAEPAATPAATGPTVAQRLRSIYNRDVGVNPITAAREAAARIRAKVTETNQRRELKLSETAKSRLRERINALRERDALPPLGR